VPDHPEPADFLNFAQEKLGKKKQDRIIAHCKECQDCADQLLEAVRDHGVETKPLQLRWWNWVSIGLILVVIAAIVVAALLGYVRAAP
jgi:hypothetical protein